jgi:hypothetical protein
MIRTLSTVALATAAWLSLGSPVQAAESASFIGSGASQFFGFEIDYAATLSGSVVSSLSGLAGYDITSVTIDGLAFPDLLPAVGADYYEFSLDIAAGTHTIAIKGLPYGGSYVGSYSLAGLGAVGFAATRRGRRS